MSEKSILKAPYGSDKTPLKIGTNGIEIPCYVLEDGTPVLSLRGLQNALGLPKNVSGTVLPKVIKHKNLTPFVPESLTLALANPIQFMRVGGAGSAPITNGYEATILIDLCYVLIDAKNAGIELTKTQEALARQAQIVTRAFSKTGIVSVIYKLTGYLDDKVSTFLNDILNKYLLIEAKQYQVTYPLELYKQWYRLNNWEWTPDNKQKRNSVLGHWTNDLIYKRIAPDILRHLKIRNPKNDKGYREHKHFQFLTNEIGEPRLREFFGGLIALARATTTWRKYVEMVNKAYPKFGDTLNLNFPDADIVE